jgi:CubicO group peptidase (beta-lactamase class C family)
MVHHLVLLFVAILVNACVTATAQADTGSWERVSIEEAELDGPAIRSLIAAIRGDRIAPGLHSFLIVRDGMLVVEEYFDGWHADELHTQQSVSKSFASALVGIAIERNDFKGVEETVLGFYPEDMDIKHLDDRKRALRLEDLLTMRSGTDYHERGPNSPHDQLNRLSGGWDRYYLDRPMTAQPGTRFQYDSGAVILTSSLLKQRTGMHADLYAEKHLFAPLDIDDYRWSKNAEGHPHTGGGLYMTPRAMAKFGLLYLRGGKWGNRQVIPEAWVRASTNMHVQFGDDHRRPHEIGYGYWWWILEPDPAGAGIETIYAALGYLGQHLFVIPEHEMVVVMTAGISGPAMHEPIALLYSHVLPAVSGPD